MYQPYLQSIKVPIAMFGVVYAAMGFAAAIGSKISHRVEGKIGEKKFSLIQKYKLSEKDAIKLLGIEAVYILQAMKTYTDFTESTYRTWTVTHH